MKKIIYIYIYILYKNRTYTLKLKILYPTIRLKEYFTYNN